MKKILISLFVVLTSMFSIQQANAGDATYALLDAQGNVTNIIVCGLSCEGGTFGGQKAVLQVAPDPMTQQPRGGYWYGPNTATYSNGTFTVNSPDTRVSSVVETDANGSTVTSTATVYGSSFSFTYEDTLVSNNELGGILKPVAPPQKTAATISVSQNNETEYLSFSERKTADAIINAAITSQLRLINSKIQLLLNLLDNWVK